MLQNDPPSEDFSALHREYFVNEVIDLRQALGLKFGDLKVQGVESRQGDNLSLHALFNHSIPGADQLARIAWLDSAHPDRTSLDDALRASLFREDTLPSLLSIRHEDGVSATINSGIGGTARYVRILCGETTYTVTEHDSVVGRISSPEGLSQLIPGSEFTGRFIASLPLFSVLRGYENLTGEDLRRSIPETSLLIESLSGETDYSGPRTLIVNLTLGLTSEKTMELRFNTDESHRLDSPALRRVSGRFFWKINYQIPS